MTGILIFVGVLWAIICLIWTRTNNFESKDLRYEMERFRKQTRAYRRITGITVFLMSEYEESITYGDAKYYDVGNEYLHIYDENDKAVGLVPNRRVRHVKINREMEASE